VKLNKQDLLHALPQSAVVHFVLGDPLEKDALLWSLRSIESRGIADTSVTSDSHWSALQRRAAGSSRWETVAPRYSGPLKSHADWTRHDGAVQSTSNILRLRGYAGYTVDGIRYTVDLFNPANELGIPYAGAGEPVVALLFEGTEAASARGPLVVRDRLVETRSFYEILKDLDGILRPQYVCGTYSMMSLLWAYVDARADYRYRPWDFLFPLHVLKNPSIRITSDMSFSGEPIGMAKNRRCTLANVEQWGDDRVLIQTRPGLESNISWEYFAVAKALGMIPVQQLVEGSAPSKA
jgi:hypothetical protein